MLRLKLVTSIILLFITTQPLWSATPIDLNNQSTNFLQSFTKGNTTIQKTQESTDFNQTTHTRIQQLYAGYPVYGADGVIHTPKETSRLTHPQIKMNGIFYQDLASDLKNPPHIIFEKTQAEKALKHAIDLFQTKSGNKFPIENPQIHLKVFVDKHFRSHWVFHISFMVETTGKPIQPNQIIDAINFAEYQSWDNIQTLSQSEGGGFGGNEKVGKYIYDSLSGDNPKLEMKRNETNKVCYLANDSVTVKDMRFHKVIAKFDCPTASSSHNNIYWDGDFDSVNGGYSPSNDALYVGKVVKEMYQKWYGIPVLTNAIGNPLLLSLIVHAKMENAYWNGKEMVFGDGGEYFYPLVSIGVGAHEMSHGFTEQHSHLEYIGQSGGLNESFSDMADQAAKFYAMGHSDWHIGSEITKSKNGVLRYMDEPTHDCPVDASPGQDCSISHVKDYNMMLDVHYSSGIFNKVFYLLSNSPNWNTKKAFDVMVQANRFYWTSLSSFSAAACGVAAATKDYHYSLDAVTKAFKQVGINIAHC